MSGRRTTSWSIASLYPNGAPVVEYSGIRVSTSQFDVPVQLFWGQRRLTTNLIDYIDFKANSVNSKGKGGGPAKSQKQYDYVATVLLGLGEASWTRSFVVSSMAAPAPPPAWRSSMRPFSAEPQARLRGASSVPIRVIPATR